MAEGRQTNPRYNWGRQALTLYPMKALADVFFVVFCSITLPACNSYRKVPGAPAGSRLIEARDCTGSLRLAEAGNRLYSAMPSSHGFHSQPIAVDDAQSREVEHWSLDSEGYLVLSSKGEEKPAVAPARASVYKALLDGLNAHSGVPR